MAPAPTSHRGEPRALELWVGGAWYLGLLMLLGAGVVVIAAPDGSDPALRLVLLLMIGSLAVMGAAMLLQRLYLGPDEKSSPPLSRRQRVRKVVSNVVLVALLLGLWIHLETRTRTVRAGGIYTLVDGLHWKQSANDVGYDGQLVLVAGGCLGLQIPDGQTYLVVWPRRAHLMSTAKGPVVTSGGRHFRPGEELHYGIMKTVSAADYSLPRACRRVTARVIYDPSLS